MTKKQQGKLGKKPKVVPVPSPKRTADVITHERFGGAKTVEQLREAGVVAEVEVSEEDLALVEPGYGEELLGDLTSDEQALYTNFRRASLEANRMERDFIAVIIHRLGDAVGSADLDKPLEAQLQAHPELVEEAIKPEEFITFFKARAQRNVAKETLYWMLASRFGCYDHQIGVRTKFRAYKLKRKW